MTVIALALLAALLLAALIGQIRINRSRAPRPQLPPPDPRQALAHGLAWTFEDGTVVNHPLCPDPIKLGTWKLEPAPVALAPPVEVKRRRAHASGVDAGTRFRNDMLEDRHARDRARRDAQHDRDRERRDEWLSTWCEPATAADYAAWLRLWLAAGGRTSHDYFPRGGWYVLRADVIPTSPPSCYGALSFQVIAPARHPWGPGAVPRTFHDACGHSTFYFTRFNGRPHVVGSGVPTYRDVRAILAGR
jgi:hypothetical protein